MEVRITARRVTVSPSARRHLEERLDKLTRYVPELRRADVKVAGEKHRVRAEVLLRVRHRDRVALGEAGDVVAALDGALERLEQQLRRLKERAARSAARTRADGPLRRSAARLAIGEPEAAGRGEGGNDASGRRGSARASRADATGVLRQRMPAGKPLSVEEAVERLESSAAAFLVFVESRSERPCVLYRRSDGRLALVEARP